MVAAQAERFKKANTMELITNYVREPAKYEAEYLKSISKESIAQYKDYFQSENDEFNNVLFHLNKNLFSMNF